MSSAEFSMWIDLYKTDPWDEHVDLGFGQVAAAVANYAGKTRSDDSPPSRACDYMPLPVPPDAVPVEPDPVEYFGRL